MSKEADRPILVRGSLRTIEYAVCANGSMPAKDFIEGLDESDQRKLVVLFRRMAEKGNVPNREQFKLVRERVFEFKKHQIRVFCFRSGDRCPLANGYKKKRNRLDQSEVVRAERIMREHLEREAGERKGQKE
ncbi:MAG: type II toxin-antitoxin system RelE/ParE family toxin [Phycisphaerae bacterium]